MYKQCKTEQSAHRQRLLEYGLLSLMASQRYEEITVSDLCEHMQIPRKSFYRYFSSKDGALHALLDHTMMDYETFSMAYASSEHRTMHRELRHFFLFWFQQKPLLDALTKSDMAGTLVERAMRHAAEDKLIPARFLPNDSAEMRLQIISFSICGLMSMVLNWHREGYRKTPEQMATIASRLIGEPLFPNLDQIL